MTVKEKKFVEVVWGYYKDSGRGSLPWRKTKNPYKILVSEIMLQQTQVDRVIPKYKAFLKLFPTVEALAASSLGEVLIAWQGLGYNRRAKMLHACAQVVVAQYQGKFPKNLESLKSLPGIGPYTAGAVLAFAFNTSVPIIETNIRSVYLHHFFKEQTDVLDSEIVRYIVLTLDTENPREWYYALMDYGSYLKKEFGNPNSKSAHYTKQSAFKGSDRQIRGSILRMLSKGASTRQKMLITQQQFEDMRVDAQIEKLIQEGMIVKEGIKFCLPK